jgi:hypothetical protein
MAQAVSRRSVIAGNRVRSQVSPRDICVKLSHTKAGFPMAVGFVQPLTEICPRNISWCGKGGRCMGVTTLPLSCADYLEICGLQPPETLTASIR